jgi:hypothetical protein
MMATFHEGDPGYADAEARWRRQGTPAPTPQHKEAISYGQAHGHGAGWGAPPAPGGQPADPAALLASLSALDGLERWAEVRSLGRLLDQEEPGLVAWAIANAPDVHAMPPVSPAEQRCRDAQAADLFARWRA